MAPSDLTLVTLEGQSQGCSDFEVLSRKRSKVRPYVTITLKYMGLLGIRPLEHMGTWSCICSQIM